MIAYVHGGCWVLSGIANDDALARRLVMATGTDVVSVGYRLAPEHPFPRPLLEVECAIRRVAARAAGQLILHGDSAGGSLVLAAALTQDAPPGAALVLVCPVAYHVPTASYRDRDSGGLLQADDLAWFWELYVPELRRRDDPQAALLRAPSFAGLPPTLLITAEYDPLRDEGLALARRLRGDGVLVDHRHLDHLMHGFLPLAGALPSADGVLHDVGVAIRGAVAAAAG